MKKIYILFIFIFFIYNIKSQTTFTNYYNENDIRAIVAEDDNIWVGSRSCLQKRNKIGNIVSYYKAKDGLVDNYIRAIAIEGSTKWIGTFGGGLSKFDGTNWTSYNSSNSGLPDNNVYDIFVESDGTKWFATDGGIAKLDGSNWTTYTTSNGLPTNSIRAVAIESNGIAWFGTYNAGVLKFDGTNWTVFNKSNSDLPNDYVWTIAIENNNIKWFGTSGGIAELSGSSITSYTSSNSDLTFNDINSIIVENNIKWIGTHGGGVVKFDGTNWENYTSSNSDLPDNYVYSTCVDNTNAKWFITRKGIFKLTNEGASSKIIIDSKLPTNSINTVDIDNNDIKWFGTADAGAVKFDNSNWTTYTTSNSNLPNNSVFDIKTESDGTVWFATSSGVAKLIGNSWTIYNTSSGLPGNSVKSIAIESDGTKWFGTYSNGLAKLVGSTWTSYDKSNSSLPDNDVSSIAIESNGTIWVATFGGGIVKIVGTNWTVYRMSNSSIPDDNINNIVIDNSGNKWISTNNSGLVKFDGTNWITYNKSNSILPDNQIKAVHIDTDNNKWIATNDGLVMYNDTEWYVFKETDGIIDNYIQDVYSYNGKVWTATLGGVSEYECATPVVDFKVDNSCTNETTVFTDISTNTGNITKYAWDLGNDGSVEYTNNTFSKTYTSEQTLSIKLTVSNISCKGDIVKNITIGQKPSPSVSGSNSVCEGESNVIYSTNNVAGNDYKWTADKGIIISGQNTSEVKINWGANAGNTDVSVLESISSGNCNNTSSYSVKINAKPVPSITGRTTACINEKNVIYSTTNVAGHSYKWAVTGGTIVSGQNTNSITVDWGSSTLGTVSTSESVIDVNCGTFTDIKNITISGDLPNPNISGTDLVCKKQSNVLYSTNNNSSSSYEWSIVAGSIISTTNTNEVFVQWASESSGIITVTETNSIGCKNSIDYDVSMKSIESLDVPQIKLKFDAVLICTNLQRVFEKYQWYNNGVSITGATGQYYVPSSVSGEYYITATDENGCENKSNRLIYTKKKSLEFEIFPNPAEDIINIKMQNYEYGKIIINIYNYSGQLLRKFNSSKNDNFYINQIPVSGLKQGIHFIEIITESNKKFYKQIIIK